MPFNTGSIFRSYYVMKLITKYSWLISFGIYILLNNALGISLDSSFGYRPGIVIFANYCLNYVNKVVYSDVYYMGLLMVVIKALVLPIILYLISKKGLFWYITTILFYDLMGNLTFFIKGNTIVDIHNLFASSSPQFLWTTDNGYLMLLAYTLYLLIVPFVVFSYFKAPDVRKLYLRSAISMLVFYVLLKLAVLLGLHRWLGRLISGSA